MKITHRVPAYSQNMTGRIEPAYQREVDRSTSRLEREFAAASRALEAAENRAERALRKHEVAKGRKQSGTSRRELQVAWATVELRRDELERISRLMSSSPAGSTHRGDRSFRPVPVRHGGNI